MDGLGPYGISTLTETIWLIPLVRISKGCLKQIWHKELSHWVLIKHSVCFSSMGHRLWGSSYCQCIYNQRTDITLQAHSGYQIPWILVHKFLIESKIITVLVILLDFWIHDWWFSCSAVGVGGFCFFPLPFSYFYILVIHILNIILLSNFPI